LPRQRGTVVVDDGSEETRGVHLTADFGLRYRIDAHLRLVEIFGDPDPREVLVLFDTIVADPFFQPGFGLLYDCRGLGPVAPDLIKTVMSRLSQNEALAWSRLAVVIDATETAGTFHLTVVPGGAPFMALSFHDIDAARLWLSIRRG
jgi:hypothetical protein